MSKPRPVRRVVESVPLQRVAEFLQTESAAGIVLMGATVLALAWANLDPSGYHDFWATKLSLPGPDHALTLHDWVGDALMAVFFFVVGLEIKREIVDGELRDPRTAIVPVAAAIGGMVIPAAIYLAVTAGTEVSRGWGIPMATDIAFAVGVLRLVAPRAPAGVSLTLLTLAIVDDLGAIAVIAIFYSSGIEPALLLVAVVVVGVILVAGRRLENPAWFVIPALILWVVVFRSGVHATVAGVLLGFATPVRSRKGREILASLEHHLHPWSSYIVLPLFALANAGIVLSVESVREAATSEVGIGIVLGLVGGKLIGITLGARIATRFGGRLPDGVGLRALIAIGLLGGIGFTVSLFVADLSFSGPTLETAKLAILGASVLAAVASVVVLRTIPRHSESDA